MSQSKKENLHKKIYYPDCRAYPSKDAVLADMKKRRDRLRQLVGYAEKIEAEERKQHEKEVKELDTLCKKNKISYKQIISFCKCISEKGFTVDDIISLISDDNKSKEEKSE